jgi:tRNA C32,U32 (ribose-2'-O)-methylase TrmJ
MLLAYEVYLASLGEIPKPKYNLATVHEVESVLKHLAHVFGEDRLSARTRAIRTHSCVRLRRVIARAPLEKRDCNVLHRICQQIDYYVKDHPKS